MSSSPKTDSFFVEMEKKWLSRWEEAGILKKYLSKNTASKKTFSFFDGPITANNPMGVHHAWGRTYKDLWQKFYNLLGYKERFQNGFDCQGLWVEVEVEKQLALKNKKEIENLVPGDKKASIAHFIQLCRERVIKFSGIQTEQSKRLGYFMNWENSYFTMSDENNYMIWFFLKKCYENGWVYKGLDSVPWCPRCETAISQHEMLTEDYKELTHETVFLKLPILTKEWDNTYLLIWTTTPWTVPANVAVAVNVKYTYAVWKNIKTKEQIIILHTDENGAIPKRLLKKQELPIHEYIFGKEVEKEYELVKKISGKELVGLIYQAPFDYLERVRKAKAERPSTFHSVVDGSEIVVAAEGTGLLHVATGAGTEDFKLGKKKDLPVISVIGDNADYLDGMKEFSNKNAKKHPELIIDSLKSKENGRYLLKTLHFTHRYPACWRCKTELVWKVADEWYIAMDRPSHKATAGKPNTLRERMVEVAKKIRWLPEFGLDRELDWLKNMHDWLISKKNRYWGLALPIYECKKCHTFEVIGSKEELKKRAVAGWEQFEGKSPHKPYIDDVVIKCKTCGQNVERINDVGNPWLDAGIIPYSTLVDPDTKKLSYTSDKKYFKEWFPANFITESFPGQFKNWFYSLIAMSTVLEDINPSSTILGYATALGEDGRPMHKSWGNMIEFNEAADKIGVDVIRWMCARQNPTENLLFGYKKADEVRRLFYLTLWNIYKFFIEYANLDKIDLSKIPSAGQKLDALPLLDRWIVNRMSWVCSQVEENLRHFNPKDPAADIERLVNDISTWYIRRSRDRVWVNSENPKDKLSFYQTLHGVLKKLCIIMSPFMPFITEEIYTNITSNGSVHLGMWPQTEVRSIDMDLIKDMELVREVAEAGHRARKLLKMKVRQPLNSATVKLPEKKKFLNNKKEKDYLLLIQAELNVKKVLLKTDKRELIDVEFDAVLSPELIMEGKTRDAIRQIQEARKKLGIKSSQHIHLTLPKEYSAFFTQIQKKVLADNISEGPELRVEP